MKRETKKNQETGVNHAGDQKKKKDRYINSIVIDK